MSAPRKEITVVKNDFNRVKVHNQEGDDLSTRLKSWIQLSCCLSGKYLIILGISGLVRVFNIDLSCGPIGELVYSFLRNFPIKCISLVPFDELAACGITARGKIAVKQQPFTIFRQIEKDPIGQLNETPITIIFLCRDSLKIIIFKFSSYHSFCCKLYKSRYFIVKLRGQGASDYRWPRLIFSDLRVSKESKKQ